MLQMLKMNEDVSERRNGGERQGEDEMYGCIIEQRESMKEKWREREKEELEREREKEKELERESGSSRPDMKYFSKIENETFFEVSSGF